MKIYVFGNEYVGQDKRAIDVARELEGTIKDISFVFVDPNEDVPFVDERKVVILDTVWGIRDVVLVEGDGIDRLVLSPRGSVHDFDLAFQLRYLKKLNKLGKVTIIGIPQEGEVDYLRARLVQHGQLVPGPLLPERARPDAERHLAVGACDSVAQGVPRREPGRQAPAPSRDGPATSGQLGAMRIL
jgi:Ni,Fe-hydrogenase maturation factor